MTMKQTQLFLLLLTILALLRSSCASLSVKNNNGNSIADQLEKRVVALFGDMHSFPIAIKRKDVEVRVRNDGDKLITFAESKKTLDLHPDQFKVFLQRFNDYFPKVNPLVQSVKLLETEKYEESGREGFGTAIAEQQREGVKAFLKFPFPLANRIMFHWKYVKFNRGGDPHEHMVFLSEEGNDQLLSKHFSATERKNFVFARTFLCAYWIKPVRSMSGEIIGSNVKYMFSGDTGGNVPKSVQNLVGPRTALESVQGLIRHVSKGEWEAKA